MRVKTVPFRRLRRPVGHRRGKIRALSNCKNGLDTNQANSVADDACFVISSILTDSEKDRFEERHWPERVPSCARFPEHVVSGTEVADLIALRHHHTNNSACPG